MTSCELSTHRAARHHHRSERGLTLVELLVASSITAVIALTLATAMSLSFRLIGSEGVQGQQVASNSILAVERQFSTDVSRAECVTTNGVCPAGVTTPAVCAGSAVCVAWCEGGSTQGASYALSGTDLVRQDAAGSLTVASEITSLSFDTSIPPSMTSPQLRVNLVAGADNPQQASFTARSLVTGAAACA
jgi:prepilin-type N-terminal cleavage/methylation domain-containing protein